MRYSTKQVKDSGVFPVFDIYSCIFREFLGNLEGGQSQFAFVERGVLCNISPCEAHFSSPPS